eukprot:TRINITY_DN2444_c0_g1_i1.p1 TRINITY_DN2444_c0_g1~~TRINITY_DN2444_c0_g1_i1.p1  ORF type:complete len:510 (+),score=95.38 TRINITY_DN2444_c0_g1_i1:48-1577(+)
MLRSLCRTLPSNTRTTFAKFTSKNARTKNAFSLQDTPYLKLNRYVRYFSSTTPNFVFKSPVPTPGAPTLCPMTDYLLEDALDHHLDVAIVHADTGESVTYGKLRERTQDLAIQFYIRGWEKGQSIAVILPNKVIFPLTVFAAAKVGLRCVLVNVSQKSRLWVNSLRPMKVDYIITTQEILHYVRDACQSLRSVKEILVLNRIDDERDKKEYRLSIEMRYDLLLGKPPGWGALPDWIIKDEEVMLQPFTAQNTRGTEIRQGQFTKSLMQIRALETDLNQSDVVAVSLPLYDTFNFIHSGTLPYLVGCKVVLTESLNPKRFFEVVQEHKVTYSHVPAAVIKELAAGKVDYDLSTLKTLLCTEPLEKEIYEALKKNYPQIKLKQGYGSIDLTPPLMLSPADKIKPGSVGVLLPDTEAKVINPATKKEVGVGEEGEIWVKGDQVFSQWWVPPPDPPRPIDLKEGKGKNKDKPKPEPKVPPPNPKGNEFDDEGFFKTGDIGKVDADGYWWITKK